MSSCKRRNGDPYLLLSARIGSKGIKELNIRFERTRGKHRHRQGQPLHPVACYFCFKLLQVLQNLHDLFNLFIESKFLLPEDSPFSGYIFPEYAIMAAWVSSLTTCSISAHPFDVSFHLIFFRTPLQSHPLFCPGPYQKLLLLFLSVPFSFKFLLA